MTAFALEQAPRWRSDILGNRRRVQEVEADPMIYVGSGKSGIALILEYLKIKSVLTNKMTPILVPSWLGTWVYAQTLDYAFPTTRADDPAPVVICYHQYGYPQNMDKVQEIAASRKAVLIEDCAHAAGSFYKDKQLGSMGDFGLFSFSKFVFCYALGGILARDAEFRSFVSRKQKTCSRSLRLFVNGFKLLDETHIGWSRQRVAGAFNGLRRMAYSRYGQQHVAGPHALALWLAKRDNELAARRANYQLLRSRADRFGICDHLECDGVAPYAVPLVVRDGTARSLIEYLQGRGIRTGIYQFDFARCVFSPDFQPCVLVPIHSGMVGEGMSRLIEGIDKCL
jgi:hypothetical protein